MSAEMTKLQKQYAGSSEGETASLPDLHDRITEAYFGKMGDEFARSTRERIHWICSNVTGKRVLDVGCSQGITAVLLGREGKSVIGIDVAKRSVEEAREYLSQETIRVQEQVGFVQGDFLTADLGKADFDTIIMAEVLEHLTRPEEFISAACERLGENGRLIVTVPFGINDFLDHKKTFYFGEPWRLISNRFNIDEVKFFGKWIGFVATLRSDTDAPTTAMGLEDGLLQTEAAFQEIERQFLKRVNSLAKEAREIRANLRATNEQNAALKKTTAENEAARAKLALALAKLKENSQRTEDTLEALRTEMQSVTSEKDKEVARLTAELSASERWTKHHESEAEKMFLALEAERSAHVESEKQRILIEHQAKEMDSRLTKSERQLEQAHQNLRERTEEVSFLQSRLEQLRAEQDDKEKDLERLKEEMDAAQARELALKKSFDEREETFRADNLDTLDTLAASQHEAFEFKKRIDAAEHEKRSLFAQATTMEKKKVLAEERADRQKNTLSFRLGNILVYGFKSWKGFVKIPTDLWKLKREWKAHTKVDSIFTSHSRDLAHSAVEIMQEQQPTPNKEKILTLPLKDFLNEVNDLKGRGSDVDALGLVKARLKLKNENQVVKSGYWLALRLRDKEFGKECLQFLTALEDPALKSWLKGKREKLEGITTIIPQLVELISNAENITRNLQSNKNRVCYCLHNSLPYSSNGYATRAHGVSQGLQKNGMDVICLTRPGFPNDISTVDTEYQELNEVDGVQYFHLRKPSRRDHGLYDYIKLASAAYEKQFIRHRPSSVLAASNHVNAIPAMIAAKRLGIPFFYEVRGFWEITRMSREPEFEKTSMFRDMVELEIFVAMNSNHLFTLTHAMKEELEKRGVETHKISLVPNSCDPTRFTRMMRDRPLSQRYKIPEETPVIGYVGSFVQYEGLDDLVKACVLLKQRGRQFKLLLVGNENVSGRERGPVTDGIIRIATQQGLMDDIIMPGRVPHEEVEAYYSLIDIAPFPRKPQPVTEMVSPMKPLEALAMEKAVVASSVRALSEMIQDGKTGLLFQKGNVEALANTLEKLICDPEMRTRLGKAGRKWVESERNWNTTTSLMSSIIAK